MALGYTGQNSSAISTQQDLGGGIGSQTFNLGSLGIGTSGTLGNVSAGKGIQSWVWYAAAAVVAVLIVLKVRK